MPMNSSKSAAAPTPNNAPTSAEHYLELERRRFCCCSSAFITPGTPSPTTCSSEKRNNIAASCALRRDFGWHYCLVRFLVVDFKMAQKSQEQSWPIKHH